MASSAVYRIPLSDRLASAHFTLEERVFSGVLAVIHFCIMLAAALIIFLFCKSKRLRNVSTTLVLDLAIADFFVGLTTFPLLIAITSAHHGFPLGVFGCEFTAVTNVLFYGTSIISLVWIALERYLAVAQRQMGPRLCAALIAGTWLSLVLLAFVPYFYGRRIYRLMPGQLYCGGVAQGPALAMVKVTLMLVCIIAIATFYYLIFRTASRTTRNLRAVLKSDLSTHIYSATKDNESTSRNVDEPDFTKPKSSNMGRMLRSSTWPIATRAERQRTSTTTPAPEINAQGKLGDSDMTMNEAGQEAITSGLQFDLEIIVHQATNPPSHENEDTNKTLENVHQTSFSASDSSRSNPTSTAGTSSSYLKFVIISRGVIFVGLMMLWFSLYIVENVMMVASHRPVSPTLDLMMDLFAALNSLGNPILFVTLDKRWGEAFREWIGHIRRRRSASRF